MPPRETRVLAAVAEIREDGTPDDHGNVPAVLQFSGHAAVFNQRTWIGPKQWGFYERVDPGFFRDVMNDDAAFLVNHDPNIILARNPTTMKLSIDERGLVADADWDPSDPDAKWANRVKRGDVSQMSFAFTVAEDKWEVDQETGEETRTLLTAGQLYDASLVTYPAYSGTDGAMRDSVAEVVKRHRGFDPREEQPVRPVVEEPKVDAPIAVDPAETLRTMRFRALAARYRLPISVRDIVAVGGTENLGGYDDHGPDDDDEGDDEDFSTDALILAEVIENNQDTIAAVVQYLSTSDPGARDPRVVTFVQNLVAVQSANLTEVSALLS